MSTKTTKLIAATLIAAFASTSPALSHGKRGGGGMLDFDAIDANANGAISKAEIKAHGLSRAQKMDTNNDGNLSEDELKASFEENGKEGKRAKRMERRIGKMLERADANDDGVLSIAEMTGHREARLDKMFEKLDADSNGELSKDELENARGKRKSKRSE